jgi:hypothetical protein
VDDDIQVTLLQHALHFTGPQALRVLALAQLLQRRDFVFVALHHDRLDVKRAPWVGLFERLFYCIGLHEREC